MPCERALTDTGCNVQNIQKECSVRFPVVHDIINAVSKEISHPKTIIDIDINLTPTRVYIYWLHVFVTSNHHKGQKASKIIQVSMCMQFQNAYIYFLLHESNLYTYIMNNKKSTKRLLNAAVIPVFLTSSAIFQWIISIMRSSPSS